jgi:PAS domain S-box-containing protein
MNNIVTNTDRYQVDETLYLAGVHEKVDKIIDRFVIFFFLFGLAVSPIYSTWLFSLVVGSLTLLIYGIAKFLVKNKFYARMISSVVLAMFVLQYIGQLHGMAELHFFFFTNIALLILYQDWRVILPYTFVTVLHHTVFAFLQWHLNMNELAQYFISYTDITFLQMGFHFGIISLMAYIAILWAVMLRNNSIKLFVMQAKSKEQNEKLLLSETKLQAALANTEKEVEKKTEHLQTKTEELLAAEEELRQSLEEIMSTQELLQQSNISLESKMLAINKTVGYMELGMDRKIITINEKLAEWLEYGVQDLEGQPHLKVVEPNYAQSNEYENFWQQMGEGKIFSKEFLRITKTGKQVWFYASYCPVKDESGRFVKIVKLAVNITEEKEKSQELLASEEELRQNLEELQTTQDKLQEAAIEQEKFVSLVKYSNAFIAMADMQGKIMFLNETAKQMSGFGENYKGTTIADYHDAAHHEISQQTIPIVMSKGLWRGEDQIINTQTKQEYITDATVFMVKNPETGQPICLATVQSDITEQKQAALRITEKEQKISRIINVLPNCVFEAILDTKTNQFRLQFINKAVIDIFGVSEETALADANVLFGAMCEGEYARFSAAMVDALKTMSAFSIVCSINKPDGSIAFLDSYNNPALLPDGNILMTTVITDITVARKAEQEIQAQNEELQANEEEMKQSLEELQATQDSLLEALNNAKLLETLIDNSTDALQGSEENGKLIYMNNVGLSRLGLTKEEMLGMYVRDFEKSFTEDGTWEAHVAAMKALKNLTIQSVNHDKTNNRDFPVEVSIRHIEIGDKGYLVATSRDVTERKKIEQEIQAQNEELQASQEELRQNLEELQATQEVLSAQKVIIEEKEINLRALIDNTKDSIFSLDRSYCFITANNTVIQQYAAAGIKIEKGVCVLDLAPTEEVRILFKSLYDRALAGEDVKMEQDYSDIKNGIIAIFELLISPMKNMNGNIIGCSISARDVTERKQAEAAIKQLSLVASKTNSAILITDNKGLVTWVNDAFVEISGYTIAEALGKKPGAMLQGKDTNPAHIQKIREGLASKKPFVQEILNYHRNGTPYWLSLSITPIFDEAGELVQFIGVETDITDIKKQKEAVENALQELKATQNQLIQSEKMASLGQLVASIAHEVNTPLGAIRSSATNISGSLKETLNHIPLFINNLTSTQNQFFVELLEKTPEKNSLLTAKEERKIRREIENLLDEKLIENAQDLADLFTDIGIYEGLEDYIAFLQEPKSKDTVQMAYKVSGISRSIDTILTATERASKVIFALKNFARHDHSGQKQKTSFNDNIETVLIIYTNQLKQGIEVIRHYTDLPEILCYPDELMQVWTNIIHNAIQAMNNKGVLTISTKIVGNHLLTSIEDTGGGIPLNIQDKIFDAFFTTKKAGEGTGLGLDIVKKIVAKHEGNIWFESKQGEGTTFFVEIPIVVE